MFMQPISNEISGRPPAPLAGWHRKLLAWAAIFAVLLIGVGGILCVTQSIRSCPDWPGCFGKLIPPFEVSPILEYSHRILAAATGLLILASAIAGLVRARRWNWILIPPLVACVLVVEVSYFGARVVLGGIAAGWAAVDLGSALLVVALMITAAVSAQEHKTLPGQKGRRIFGTPFARLALTTVAVVYIVFVSGVLVAGKGSISACLGWPVYSPLLIQLDVHGVGNILRLALSILGLGLLLALLWQAWRTKNEHVQAFKYAGWLLAAFLMEALLQILLLIFGFKVALLVPYTLSAALLWGALVALSASLAHS
jgi:cytochrome c oxidase assembly protein subunit 15